MKNKFLSATIMIPAFNSEGFIGDALESAKNQSYKGEYEILVVNDGSTDDTRGIVEWRMGKDSKIRLINQSNEGSSSARNVLIEESGGDILFGLDADDLLDGNALKRVMPVYEKCSSVNHVYTDQREIDEEGRQVGLRLRRGVHQFFDDLTYRCHFQGHLKSFRKSVIGDRRFDEGLKSAVDWDFFLNMLPSLNVLHLPEVLYSYRMNQQGISFTKREEVRDNSVGLVAKYLKRDKIYGGRDVEISRIKLRESLTYYDHLMDGKSTMKSEAKVALEKYLLRGE
ncbi:MAG: glycosyltransferase family 2 protein [Nanoarchaeota archaeon]|nr:glycosyltransferase family 2 protein [Nanoarchaeota archaeon]